MAWGFLVIFARVGSFGLTRGLGYVAFVRFDLVVMAGAYLAGLS